MENNNKRALLIAHLDLIKCKSSEARNSRKILFKQNLSEIRLRLQKKCSLQEGKLAISILPEEVWCTILDYITEANDKVSCAQTCQLFQNILGKTKTEWLFGEVFPFVLTFLKQMDVFNCRLVCKNWCSTMDLHFQSPSTTEEISFVGTNDLERFLYSIRPSYKGNRFDYHTIRVPTSDADANIYSIGTLVRENMKSHPRNPFIGRAISVDAIGIPLENGLDFPTDYCNLLNDFGQHIKDLCLSLISNSPDSYVFGSPWDYYSIISETLTKCPNLRCLSLGPSKSRQFTNRDKCAIGVHPLIDHSCLNELSFNSYYKSPGNRMIQNKIIKKYSSQLKALKVYTWNTDLYHELPWENLQKLYIVLDISNKIINSLIQVNAPNLHNLILSLQNVRERRPKLDQIMKLLNKFERLNFLTLRLSRSFADFSSDEIISVNPVLPCCPSVITLELLFAKVNMSYDFLISFPLLRTLKIHYRSLSAGRRDRYEDGEVIENEDNVCLIDIANYIWRDPNNLDHVRQMYKSNIWEYLPLLQVFVVGTYTKVFNQRGTKKIKMVFTRKGYLYWSTDRENLSQ